MELTTPTLTAPHPNTGMAESLLRNQAAGSKDPEKEATLLDAAQQFESFFISMLFQEMRKSLPGNPVLSGGNSEKIFQGQLDNEFAVRMSRQGALGIATMIHDQVTRPKVGFSSRHAVETYRTTNGELT